MVVKLVGLGVALAACGRIGFDLPAGVCESCVDGSCRAGLACGSDQRCQVVGSAICSEQPDAGMLDDAAPDAVVPAANVVFVTSTTHLATLGSLVTGDAICLARALDAQLPGRFVAWLSDATIDAPGRIAAARGFRRVDGLALADVPMQLISAMRRPIALDETGAMLAEGELVLTGTDGNGAENANCNGYNDPGGTVTVGSPWGTRATFTSATSLACSVPAHLYCVQTDRVTPIPAEPAIGRRAFLSTGWSPGGGITGADIHCGADAITAGLTGSFRAFIASGVTAGSRFDPTGANWVRIDGVPIASSPSALLAGSWLAPINLRAGGGYVQTGVWFGAAGLGDVGSPTDTCAAWVGMVGMGIVGDSASIGTSAASDPYVTPRLCSASAALYCLER